MKILQSDNCFNSKNSGKCTLHAKEPKQRRFTRTITGGARRTVGISARIFACALVLAIFPALRIGAQSAEQWKLPDIPWAFPIRDKVPPAIDDRSGPQHVPGSTKSY